MVVQISCIGFPPLTCVRTRSKCVRCTQCLKKNEICAYFKIKFANRGIQKYNTHQVVQNNPMARDLVSDIGTISPTRERREKETL
mmetsp:Transcript_24040/g.29526  ORF Transcript_24040/g.29526 Transcript_24040/m.29526 type:complete len:85 (+) Transcript_24040:137-391(+)